MQPLDDTSPTTEGRNAFYDVLQREDELTHFGLCANVDGNFLPFVAVNLANGSFEVNGAQFWAQDMSRIPIDDDTDLRLIYYRQIRRHFNPETSESQGIDVKYHLGWQATIDGKNYKSVLGFE